MVHERILMAVPERLTGRQRAGCRRSSRPPTTPSSRRPGCSRGERLLVHGGAGWGRDRRGRLGARRGAGHRDRARREAAASGVAALGATVIEPEGFVEHGPFDVILELVGAPNLAANLEALDIRRPDRHDRDRRRRDARSSTCGR